jgi:hypothetical protein
MNVKWIVAGLFVVVVAVFVAVAAGRGVRVEVKNVGETPLEAVQVFVKGAEYDLGDLAPGESKSVKVEPTSESDVWLRWKSEGKSAAGTIDCYMEPSGYHGTVTVQLRESAVVDYKAEIETGLF